MRRSWILFAAACLLTVSAGAVPAQDDQAARVLAAAREAIGGDKLDRVESLTVEGRSLRTTPAGATMESEFEMALEMPDKYVRRDVLSAMGNMSIYRMSGFNGEGLINEIDTPPQLSGGMNVRFRVAGAGGAGEPTTPEEKEKARLAMLLSTKKDYARLLLGMFPQSPASYPLTFAYAGTAESPDGKADVLDVKGEGGFSARLFLDSETHLPLMLSWMDKEPIMVTRSVGPGGSATFVGAGGGAAVAGGSWSAAGPPQATAHGQPRKEPTAEEREKIEKDIQAQVAHAEARRKEVEFRIFYSDYKEVGGVLLPHRFQRSIAGKPTEETVFEKVKVNPKIEADRFKVSK